MANNPSLQDCANAIRGVLGDFINDADAKSAVIYMKNRAQALAKDTAISVDEALEMVARELTQSEHQNKLHQLRSQLDTLHHVKQAVEGAEKLKYRADVLAQKLGTQKNRSEFGASHGVAQVANLRHMTWLNGFYEELAAADLVKLFESKALSDRGSNESLLLSRELWSINNSEGKAPSVTGNKQIYELAKLMDKWQWVVNSEMNLYGAVIKRTEGFISSQTHDPSLLRAAGRDKDASYEAWSDVILRNADLDRVFGTRDAAKIKQMLKDVHENLYNGYFGRTPHDDLVAQNTNFTLAGSLADRLSKRRLIHFATPEGFHEYNTLFGKGSVTQNFLHRMEMGARQVALMQEFGPNPSDAYRKIVRITQEAASKLADSAKQMDRYSTLRVREDLSADPNWLQATGAANERPGSSIYDGVETLRTLTKAAALGGSGVASHIIDPAQMAMVMHLNGIPWPQAMFNSMFKKWVPGAITKEQKAYLKSLGFISELEAGYLVRGMSESNQYSRWAHKVAGWVFKWNGLDRSTLNSKRVLALELSRLLATNADSAHSALPVRLQEALARHRIGQLEWDILRKLPTEKVGDENLVDPARVFDLDDAALAAFARQEKLGMEPRDIHRLKNELWARFAGYLHDEANIAVGNVGPEVRKWIYGSTFRGTPEGTVARLIGDLKSFPLGVVSNLVGREFLRKGHSNIAQGMMKSGWQPYKHVAMFAAQATVLGYLSWSAKEMLRGRTPPPLVDDRGRFRVDNVMGAMMRGGAMGILGDFFLSEYDQRSRGLLAQLAGPTLGMLETVYAAGSKFKTSTVEGEPSIPITELMRIGEGVTPGISIPWIKVIVNHLFYYSLQEMLKPGMFQRQRKAIYESTGQRELGIGLTPWEGSYLDPFR